MMMWEKAMKGIVDKYSTTEGVEWMTIVKGNGLELRAIMHMAGKIAAEQFN